MQVTETLSDGLKRELQITIPASELSERVDTRLNELKGQVRIKGFRPGKVPMAHLKRMFGERVMAEELEKAVTETSDQAIAARDERPALRPDIKLTEDKEEIDRVLKGEADLAYTLKFEALPDIELTDFAKLTFTKPTADVPADKIDESLEALRERATSYEVEEGRAAEEGDRVTIDFVGKIDGEPFDGGTGEDMFVVLGQGQFIPGFEDGIKGAKAGEERTVPAKFPDEYQEATLAGKEAAFDVKVKDVAKATVPPLDDSLAEQMGLENLEMLRSAISDQIAGQIEEASRARVKRALLDALNDAHTFELPPTLVESEFEGIWKQVTEQLEKSETTFEDEGKTEDGAREEYMDIAGRRVRLGLVLSEVGDKNDISVADEELTRALIDRARQYPGQEKAIFDAYRESPEAMMQLRAPIYEDKVVDFILELATVKEEPMDIDELMKPIDDEESDA